jgi:small-conductance mechanosensitive channel/CRP-like cAMP-binding protein
MIFIPLLLFMVLVVARLWGGDLLAAHFSPAMIGSIHRALVIMAVVAAALFIDGLIRFFYWHRYWRRRRGRETPALIRDLLTVALLLLALSVGLWWQEGLSFTGLITASGATAVILGIALQTVIQDLFSGLSVNLEGSYALGDWLTIYADHLPEPAYGRVTGITWRSTFLTLVDGRRLMVPNHLATANPVLNHSRPREPKRHEIEVSVDIRVPCKRVTDMLLGEAMKVVRRPGYSPVPGPKIQIDRISGDAIFYHVHFYADPAQLTPNDARSAMYGAVLDVLQQNAVAMPVTQIEMAEPPNLSFTFGERETLEGLRHAELLAGALNEEQMAFLVSRCRATAFDKDAILMQQGDAASSMFILLEGAARVTVRTAGGAEQEVAVLATGDIVGEMSLMTGAPRSATVAALTAMRALEVTKDAIAELVQQSPGLFQSFSRILARRQEELNAVANRSVESAPTANALLARMRAFFTGAVR